jgi:hypothetical protein
MRTRSLELSVCVMLVACSSAGTGPSVPEIPAIIGAFCVSNLPVIVRAPDGGATVTVSRNKTTYQDVRRSDGVVIRQEVRSCGSFTCTYPKEIAAPSTDQTLLSNCQSFAG